MATDPDLDIDRLMTLLSTGITLGSETSLQVVVKWEIVRRALALIERFDCSIDDRIDSHVTEYLQDP